MLEEGQQLGTPLKWYVDAHRNYTYDNVLDNLIAPDRHQSVYTVSGKSSFPHYSAIVMQR